MLEIMLAVAIVAIIAAFSLSLYSQQVDNFLVNKTALQMQQWLDKGTEKQGAASGSRSEAGGLQDGPAFFHKSL